MYLKIVPCPIPSCFTLGFWDFERKEATAILGWGVGEVKMSTNQPLAIAPGPSLCCLWKPLGALTPQLGGSPAFLVYSWASLNGMNLASAFQACSLSSSPKSLVKRGPGAPAGLKNSPFGLLSRQARTWGLCLDCSNRSSATHWSCAL